MSKKNLEVTIQNRLNQLQCEELRLFHSYNRHAQGSVKLEVLSKLTVVINQIETIKSLLSC